MGMPVTERRIYRSISEGPPHTAPVLGPADRTAAWARVADAWNRQLVRHLLVHSTPGQATAPTAAGWRAMPSQHRAQVLTLLRDAGMHAPSEFGLGHLKFGADEPQDHEVARPRRRAVTRETKKIENRPSAWNSAASARMPDGSELRRPRLFEIQLQPEMAQAFFHRALEAPRVGAELEYGNATVGIPCRDHFTARTAPHHCLSPSRNTSRKQMLANYGSMLASCAAPRAYRTRAAP